PGTRDWDDELTKARAALNWEKHFELAFDTDTARAYHDEDMDVDTDFCAMCGHDWCSVRISKEIQDWASGNAEGFARNGDGRTVKSDALTPEQQKILEQRGYLSPEEIHKLAAKKKKKVAADKGEEEAPSCHSDYVDPDKAEQLKQEELVQLNTAEAHGLSKHDSVI
ncbi:MAG: phosphomethylpyrimidine synthase ThiC, partial [Planctomycetota bacterium]